MHARMHAYAYVQLLKGALTFKDRNVGDVMTPISKCYSLNETATLNYETIMDILGHGHTRVPVYSGHLTSLDSTCFDVARLDLF